MRRLAVRCATVVLAAAAAACGDPLELEVVSADLTGDLTVSPDDPGLFEVRVTNISTLRVVWGTGSSSCQLTLDVFVDGEPRNIDFRACTEDLVEQGLDPGESRSEIFEWGGQIDVSGLFSTLPDGRYPVVGRAGDRGESEAILVTVSGSEPASSY